MDELKQGQLVERVDWLIKTLSRVEVKVDAIDKWRWQLAGATTLLSAGVSLVVLIAIELLKG